MENNKISNVRMYKAALKGMYEDNLLKGVVSKKKTRKLLAIFNQNEKQLKNQENEEIKQTTDLYEAALDGMFNDGYLKGIISRKKVNYIREILKADAKAVTETDKIAQKTLIKK